MTQRTPYLPVLALTAVFAGCQPAQDIETESADTAASAVTAVDPAAIREGIDQTNRAAEEAATAGDITTFVQQTYTEDAIILPPGAPVISGHEGITGFWTTAGEQLGLTGIQLETQELVPLGPDAAYEIGLGTLETAQGPVQAKYVVIWRRGDDGRWRWHVDIWNDMPAAEPAT